MDQSPQPKYINEDKPCPTGNRFARMFQAWYGWLLFAIGVVITIIVFLMFINVINDAPLLLPLLLFFFWLLCLGMLFFGIFYWGARFRDRLARVKSGECESDKEVPADENKQRERLLNLGGSQWLLFYFVIAIFFVLLFLTIFLWTEGLETWQPLPVAPTNIELMNFILIKGFQMMVLGVFSGAFIIILYTGSDFSYRQFRSLNTWHMQQSGNKGLSVDQSYAYSGVNVLRDHV